MVLRGQTEFQLLALPSIDIHADGVDKNIGHRFRINAVPAVMCPIDAGIAKKPVSTIFSDDA